MKVQHSPTPSDSLRLPQFSRRDPPRLRLDLANLLHAFPEEHDVILDEPPPRRKHARRDDRQQRKLRRDEVVRERRARPRRGWGERRRRARVEQRLRPVGKAVVCLWVAVCPWGCWGGI